jgi:hypothetical protein
VKFILQNYVYRGYLYLEKPFSILDPVNKTSRKIIGEGVIRGKLSFSGFRALPNYQTSIFGKFFSKFFSQQKILVFLIGIREGPSIRFHEKNYEYLCKINIYFQDIHIWISPCSTDFKSMLECERLLVPQVPAQLISFICDQGGLSQISGCLAVFSVSIGLEGGPPSSPIIGRNSKPAGDLGEIMHPPRSQMN